MALFEQHAILRLPGQVKFAAVEAFKPGAKIGGRVLSAVSWNFSNHFLSVTETNVAETNITVWALLYSAGDKWILETLNGLIESSTCTLAHIYAIMLLGKRASNHLDGRSNFAYAHSPGDRRLWAVHWFVNSSDDWTIGSVQVPHPEIDWRAGSRLFTRGAPL